MNKFVEHTMGEETGYVKNNSTQYVPKYSIISRVFSRKTAQQQTTDATNYTSNHKRNVQNYNTEKPFSDVGSLWKIFRP